jgi:hypothetical protein
MAEVVEGFDIRAILCFALGLSWGYIPLYLAPNFTGGFLSPIFIAAFLLSNFEISNIGTNIQKIRFFTVIVRSQ